MSGLRCFEKHETIIEVASSSSDTGFIASSSREEQDEILEYGAE